MRYVTITESAVPATRSTTAWWREAVVYQVYIRSFADGDGDGTGDIAGLRARLPYLADLGVDALWINPWYPSPMADSGYDVSDYRDIEPVFGDLDAAEAMIAEAHELGLRVLLDIVPNHSSDAHEWFRAALAAGPGSPERARYIFRDGVGDQPPNDWESRFGGPAWTRVFDGHRADGQWYLHLFAPGQPDFDWTHPEVRADFERTLRFWFDRGVDGFRIDVAHGLVKKAGLPDVLDDVWAEGGSQSGGGHPHWDVDGVHEIYRGWREIADSYADPRVFVAEAWVSDPDRLVRYIRGDELHTAFNFDFLVAPWRADAMRVVIDKTLESHASVGAPPTWVLSNHDVLREVSRYARPQDASIRTLDDVAGVPADLELGLRRARAAALLMLALPGGAYVYQGAELGLPEVEDIPAELRQDPTFAQTDGERLGRDGCRVPMPWSGDEPPYGFGGESTWLPQPDDWAALTAESEAADPGSTLNLYRAALRIRRELPALGDGTLTWHDAGEGVLSFTREPSFGCIVTMAGTSAVPAGATVLLSSAPLTDNGTIPSDTAVWFTA